MNNDPELITQLTADVVSAYVSNNALPAADLPVFLNQVHTALSTAQEPLKETIQEPAVPIKKAVTPSYVTCLECGEEFKSLKRHLNTAHDQTPDDYREKWNLRSDFPMVAPEYSKRRAETAKKMGLGRKPGQRPKSKS
ncbi:MucR family transcriptional regulator [Euryhalocaulis caribicus]|uniref:MucR family transcriptional regulator n=1 Tax=Euryhalocaulis caribicus TaxID=1161401 RepID=UPI0009DB95F2|nr:MucR family transcriptional regulator [Euryhalocaulis caribicus]